MNMDRATSGLLTTLYSAPMRAELWEVFLADFSRMCGVSKAALIIHDLQDQQHRIAASFGDTVKESVEDYERYYYQFDEWTQRAPRAGGNARIVRGAEIWPEADLLKSVYYHEFLKRFDTCELACLFAGATHTRFEALSMYRGPKEAPFDMEQLAHLRMIGPHMQTALAIRRRLLALESRTSDLESALDWLGTALVLVDTDGKPVLANQAARRICSERDGLHLSSTRLSAQNASENGRLQEIIAKAITAGNSKSNEHGGAMLISRSGKRPLQVLSAPFISPDSAQSIGAVAVVFISNPDRKPVPRSEILRELYGLTQAEAQLAIALLKGKSLAETAELLEVRYETARSQIKSVLHKTGTQRQGELILLLSNLPGPNR